MKAEFEQAISDLRKALDGLNEEDVYLFEQMSWKAADGAPKEWTLEAITEEIRTATIALKYISDFVAEGVKE